jgi:hypothetical protein
MTTVVISPFMTLNFLEGGGHFWVYLQYVQGLRQAGCDVYWLEQLPAEQQLPDGAKVEAWLERLRGYGLGDKVILATGDGPGGDRRYVTTTGSSAQDVFAGSDLLLNFHYAMDADLLAAFRRTALVDIDPGLLQMWMSAGQVRVAPHDVYLTTGETVGTAEARFPDCGLEWHHIRPPVSLDLWPYTFDPACEAFTTVTDWWGAWAPEIVDDRLQLYDNTKRASFLPFVELGSLTRQPLELAVLLTSGDGDDRRLLERHGWRVRQSSEVSSTPERYRDYIQRSRGEISCVKPSCIKLQNAWISDRSLCYLASGKPVVVQDTGPSAHLPGGDGFFRFSTPDQAAAALAAVNADYEGHCRAARQLAPTHFDARRTAERVLDVSLA